ncbi:uncharacterized protein LOC113146570 [Cyclospora cayetanensis]|uniref:Uncharacterized protein LOC113146570 n=1 Tax=Cyclospora cayetanensis TaxID=88456 RepID=A0A6P6RRF1_9EIME|nr:uncharacterized protein LOC113146570 [Cyclospora cayetanensis]
MVQWAPHRSGNLQRVPVSSLGDVFDRGDTDRPRVLLSSVPLEQPPRIPFEHYARIDNTVKDRGIQWNRAFGLFASSHVIPIQHVMHSHFAGLLHLNRVHPRECASYSNVSVCSASQCEPFSGLNTSLKTDSSSFPEKHPKQAYRQQQCAPVAMQRGSSLSNPSAGLNGQSYGAGDDRTSLRGCLTSHVPARDASRGDPSRFAEGKKNFSLSARCGSNVELQHADFRDSKASHATGNSTQSSVTNSSSSGVGQCKAGADSAVENFTQKDGIAPKTPDIFLTCPAGESLVSSKTASHTKYGSDLRARFEAVIRGVWRWSSDSVFDFSSLYHDKPFSACVAQDAIRNGFTPYILMHYASTTRFEQSLTPLDMSVCGRRNIPFHGFSKDLVDSFCSGIGHGMMYYSVVPGSVFPIHCEQGGLGAFNMIVGALVSYTEQLQQ